MKNVILSTRSVVAAGLLLAGLAGPAYGQMASGKPTVAIMPFSSTEDAGASRYATRAVEGLIAARMAQMGRITLLDRTQAATIASERENQQSVAFIESDALVKQGKALGAQLVVTGNIDKVALDKTRLDDGSDIYKANLTVTLRIVDVTTGEVKSSGVISADANSGGKRGLAGLVQSVLTMHTTPEDAITASVKNAVKGVDIFLSGAFPARFIVASVERMDGTKGQFLLDGGKNLGGSKGIRLVVVESVPTKVGARTVVREMELGTIRILRLDGDELSVGEMENAADVVAAKLAAGKTIYAILR
ncbi:MAG TPA: hypothetical protein VM166_14980 [Gemmatimonadaceae bacterium]|nr:hypothetical protein [Gemmatimonadaceae bacterium]